MSAASARVVAGIARRRAGVLGAWWGGGRKLSEGDVARARALVSFGLGSRRIARVLSAERRARGERGAGVSASTVLRALRGAS